MRIQLRVRETLFWLQWRKQGTHTNVCFSKTSKLYTPPKGRQTVMATILPYRPIWPRHKGWPFIFATISSNPINYERLQFLRIIRSGCVPKVTLSRLINSSLINFGWVRNEFQENSDRISIINIISQLIVVICDILRSLIVKQYRRNKGRLGYIGFIVIVFYLNF